MIPKVGTFVRTLADAQQYPSSYKLHGFSADGCIAYVGASDDKTLIPMEASSIYPSNWNRINSLDGLRVNEAVTLFDGTIGTLRQIVFLADCYDDALTAVEVKGTIEYLLFRHLVKTGKTAQKSTHKHAYRKNFGVLSVGDHMYLSMHGVARSGLKYHPSQRKPCKVVSIFDMVGGGFIDATSNPRAAQLLVAFYDDKGEEVASDIITGDCVTYDVKERAYDDSQSTEVRKAFSYGDKIWVRGSVDVVGKETIVVNVNGSTSAVNPKDVKHQ